MVDKGMLGKTFGEAVSKHFGGGFAFNSSK
jgi:hypothetical protein